MSIKQKNKQMKKEYIKPELDVISIAGSESIMIGVSEGEVDGEDAATRKQDKKTWGSKLWDDEN